jgi:AGZA family xanthine/uracil permease-like MFS transporter
MIDSIPFNLRIAIGAGVGLFIGFLGLQKGGIVINDDVVLVQLGDFASIETLLAALSFIIILVLGKRKIPGEIIIGILTTTLIAFLMGMVSYEGVFSKPPDISPTLMKLDILGALDVAMISVIMSFLFVNLFDTTGTLIGVASRANLLNDEGEAKNLDKALKADSSASIFGTFFGCSPVTSYVESSAGVEVGGRTGLTAVIVGILFIFAIFLAPLSKMVPEYATAGALLYVCFLMLSGMQNLNWDDSKELIPALIIMVMIPLTYSIANGIALGFLVYIVLKISSGELYKISSGAWFLTIIFISNFIFLQN